jgi:transcriptional regulator with XRE-family HTH domain
MPGKTKQKAIGNRLSIFRKKELKIESARQMALAMKIDPSQYLKIESGAYSMTLEHLEYFATKHHLNLNWLITGKGERYYYPDTDNRMKKIRKQLSELNKALK